MSFRRYMGALMVGLMLLPGAARAEDDFVQIRDSYVQAVRPLQIEANQAWWEASTTGSESAYARREKADNAIAAMHADRALFARLKALRASGAVTDAVQRRELEVMYRSFLPFQADPELTKRIITLEAEVDKIFNTHRSEVGGQRLTENDVRKVLATTTEAEQAREAWEGYMAVGRKVAPPLKELVGLRNEVARKLGYRNYFEMKLDSQEFTPQELVALFDGLDDLTREPFAKLKGRIDAHMKQRFGADTVRPWMLGDLFFQEAPELTTVSLDAVYEGKDPVKLSEKHYNSFGMQVDGILSRSDLYEREGKSPHAFCTSIDREQDIRVLCNVRPNAQWMDTMHHELGHGVYDQYIGAQVPYLLREPAHTLTTEGMAMLFGELTHNREFLDKVVGVPADQLDAVAQANRDALRAERLIFSRWVQVMFRFEKAMYENPDQDLNALWWQLKKEYQLQEPPTDLSGHDYGAKMHVVGAPVYYHNYLIGDLFAAQVYTHLARKVLGVQNPHETSLYGRPEAGEFLKVQVFGPGNLYDWRELTKRVTGEPLSPKAFAELFLD